MPHEPAPDYSIIIPAYNEAELLPATLERVNAVVAEITTHRGEIVVTDNDSTDSTGEIARRHGARVIEEPIRQIARARNAGGKHSCGRYLIFVDADTLITAELLRQSLAALDGGDCVG
ncbi:MAG: glycosyltransferase, partial [Lentisphaeria bacterium]|nr:glycosyltransferase [Lentisphaeria bacterium]